MIREEAPAIVYVNVRVAGMLIRLSKLDPDTLGLTRKSNVSREGQGRTGM